MNNAVQDVKHELNGALGLLRKRLAEGATLESLADEFGVSHPTVSRWKDGNRLPVGANKRRVLSWYREQLAHNGTERPMTITNNSELAGRALEVEALLAFALERQRLLRAALAGDTAAQTQASVEATLMRSAAAVEKQAAGG